MPQNTPRLGLPYPVGAETADIPRDIQALAVALDSLVYIIGEVRTFALAAPPAKWIPSGTVQEQAAYPELFAAVAGTWNIGGEGGTQFRAGPAVQGRTVVGAGQGSGLTNRPAGSSFGAEAVVLTADQLAAHGHTVADPGHIHGMVSQRSSAGPGPTIAQDGSVGHPLARRSDGGFWEDIAVQANGTGIGVNDNGQARNVGHNNLPPSIAVLICIYAGR
jgi:microcystin-dependent protein